MVSAFGHARSSEIRSNYSASGSNGQHITLGDWIGRVRCKRREMRRKNANLRVAAMLATTLRRAEADLRVRQQERAHKWAEFNQQINQLHDNQFAEQQEEPCAPTTSAMDQLMAAVAAESSSSSFVVLQTASTPSSLSSSPPRIAVDEDQQQQQQQQHHQPLFQSDSQQQQHHQYDQQQQQQQESDSSDEELWRNELSDLDQFMHSLNQVKTCVVR